MNCSQCPSHCCGASPVNPPILTPDEANNFFTEFEEQVPGTKLFRLKRKNGVCIFHSSKGCKVYINRPIECRLYPYSITYVDNILSLRLDDKCFDYKNAPLDQNIQHLIKYPEWLEEHSKQPD